MGAYGSLLPSPEKKKRPRMNVCALCLLSLVPWVVFVLLLAVGSFWRFPHPKVTIFLFAVSFVIIVLMVAREYSAYASRRSELVQKRGPRFSMLAVVSSALLLAWLLALVLGLINYHLNMLPWFEGTSGAMYPSVDPAAMQGTQVLDASQVYFVETAKLNTSMSMGFQHGEWFCVAPVVTGTLPLAHYDFWAVGTDCCGDSPGSFACGEVHNNKAHAGIRLLNTGQRDYYRLAVQQAESAFKIKAEYPIFFEWVQDPNLALNVYADSALKLFVFASLAAVGFNMCVVITAILWLYDAK